MIDVLAQKGMVLSNVLKLVSVGLNVLTDVNYVNSSEMSKQKHITSLSVTAVCNSSNIAKRSTFSIYLDLFL